MAFDRGSAEALTIFGDSRYLFISIIGFFYFTKVID